jgi:Allene oxide cyclase barrel like domain
MLTRLAATGAALGVVALTAGSMGPATGHGGGDRHGHHGDVIRVLSTNTEESFLDLGDTGPSLGDEFVFTSDLTKHGASVGHTGVVCTVTSVAREETQCVGTAWFDKHGQIAIQGLVAGEPEVFSFPITGGTGAFESTGGTLVVKELSDDDDDVTRELLTFFLD